MLSTVSTLEELRHSDLKGAALADAVQGLRPHHIPLVRGLRNVYVTLANMGYLDAHEMRWPPHGSRSASWRGLGISEEAHASLPQVPLLTYPPAGNELPIAPEANPLD